MSMDKTSSSKQSGDAKRGVNFKGDISVRVVAVDKTGLLQIKGTKVVDVDKNKQSLNFSGWVRPEDISTAELRGERARRRRGAHLLTHRRHRQNARRHHRTAPQRCFGHDAEAAKHQDDRDSAKRSRCSRSRAPLSLVSSSLKGQEMIRIRDLTIEDKAIPVRLLGYGLVIGLDGTGDRVERRQAGRHDGQLDRQSAPALRRPAARRSDEDRRTSPRCS